MYNTRVKRRDDTSAAAAVASYLFCKRAFGVSELRPDKDGELCCCEYSRNIDPRAGVEMFELIDPRRICSGNTGESIHVRGVSFLNRISIIRFSLNTLRESPTELYLVS